MSDDERRARLAARHALAPAFRAGSAEDAARAMTALHATEPATVYLSCRARGTAITTADVDRALYDDRSLVKQLAMRRTLFVFPRDLLPAVWPSASARVAATERSRMTRDVVASGLAADGHDWLDRARAEVLAALADAPEGRPAQELRRAVPAIDVKVTTSAGEIWSAHRVLTHLGVTADIVRGTNTAGWHASRPRWTLMRHWLGEVPAHRSAAQGYRELVRRWLASFGPGTEEDLTWWLGSTKAVVRAALAELAAVPVSLDHGATGWLLPDDLAPLPGPGPWAALLPVLDPTVMGWQARDFYLGAHRDHIFDRRGNAGTTAWLDGRVVGCWVQDAAGAVRVRLLQDVPAAGRRLLDEEAERLTAWLGGFRVPSLYSSPAMRSALAALGPAPDPGASAGDRGRDA
ncbi:winged helix DNA-binding domain-containing protein [Couchioplanes caeruleus]|uniref:winged helix DNA-binding domain-containing protein n=1 Tax=Couchioplanes caeruleus TaxID=56438 RepID=UPI0020BE10F6|nr:winged helix DNA-binding domain-containing protein [Couchioplanes caeruleus]UQU61308.1 winged helix DNA-binding domain-containing protein [Couchioplanes caeruleus]